MYWMLVSSSVISIARSECLLPIEAWFCVRMIVVTPSAFAFLTTSITSAVLPESVMTNKTSFSAALDNLVKHKYLSAVKNARSEERRVGKECRAVWSLVGIISNKYKY